MDTSDALPVRGCELQVPVSHVSVVSLCIQRGNRYEGAADSRCVQHPVEGKFRLSVTIWYSDNKHPTTDGQEMLLIGGVQVDWGCKR